MWNTGWQLKWNRSNIKLILCLIRMSLPYQNRNWFHKKFVTVKKYTLSSKSKKLKINYTMLQGWFVVESRVVSLSVNTAKKDTTRMGCASDAIIKSTLKRKFSKNKQSRILKIRVLYKVLNYNKRLIWYIESDFKMLLSILNLNSQCIVFIFQY